MADWNRDCEIIRQTTALYCQLLDDQRYVELAELFCSDGELPWEGRLLRGRNEIAQSLPETQRPRGETRHLAFGSIIDVRGMEAGAWSDVMVTVHPPDAPAMIGWLGRYHDRFKHEDGVWRISRHVAVGHGEALPEDVQGVPGRVFAPS